MLQKKKRGNKKGMRKKKKKKEKNEVNLRHAIAAATILFAFLFPLLLFH